MKKNIFSFPKHTFIVAEIGVNHEGDFKKAAEMIKLAAQSGADAVKFQTYLPEEYVSISQPERFARIKRFQLSFDEFRQLAKIAEKNNVLFMSTPVGLRSLKLVSELCVIIKISSGDINNYPLLKEAAKSGRKIIFSTGLSTVPEIAKAIRVMSRVNPRLLEKQNLTLLHCVAAYPAPEEELNLCSIPFLIKKFKLPVGYSDHTKDILAAQIAVALGASVVEKHFTYRKEGQDFHDHHLSANPQEFREMVDQIRRIERMKGVLGKKPMPAEMGFLNHIRRSYAASGNIEAGQRIKRQDICLLRPGIGFSVDQEKKLLGRKVKRTISQGEIILEKDLGSR